GRSDRLSLAAVAPDLAAAARRHRSLTLGLRADRRASPPSDVPLFLGLRGGLQRLTDRLAKDLDVRTGTEVTALPRGTVVLAVPAPDAARLVRAASPAAADQLDAIRYASVAVATLASRREDVGQPLDGRGF